MEQEIKLSKPMKQAGTRALTDLGFSVRKIAEIMKLDPTTVLKYQKVELNEEFEQFSNAIKKVYLEQDFELTQLAFKNIKHKIKTARFFELVGLLKVVRDLQKPAEPTVISTQIAYLQQIERDKKEFALDKDEVETVEPINAVVEKQA